MTFGCLNNFAKLSLAALDLWASILVAVPNSRMIVHTPSGKPVDKVMHSFERKPALPKVG